MHYAGDPAMGCYGEPPESYGYFAEEPYLAEDLPYGEVDPAWGEPDPYGQYEPLGYYGEEYPLGYYGEGYPLGYYGEEYPLGYYGQHYPPLGYYGEHGPDRMPVLRADQAVAEDAGPAAEPVPAPEKVADRLVTLARQTSAYVRFIEDPTLLGYYGQAPEMVGYGQYEPLGEEYPVGGYAEPDIAGYVRETDPPFNAGCPLPTNVAGFGAAETLDGYERPRSVSATCDTFTPAPSPGPSAEPETFKPLW